MNTLTRALAAVFCLAVFVTACGDITVGPNSALVGAACAADGECRQQCLINDRHFPGGMCTLACASDADCPGGSACIAEEGGVCVVACRSDADCAAFGRGFACDQESRQGGGGEVSICRVP